MHHLYRHLLSRASRVQIPQYNPLPTNPAATRVQWTLHIRQRVPNASLAHQAPTAPLCSPRVPTVHRAPSVLRVAERVRWVSTVQKGPPHHTPAPSGSTAPPRSSCSRAPLARLETRPVSLNQSAPMRAHSATTALKRASSVNLVHLARRVPHRRSPFRVQQEPLARSAREHANADTIVPKEASRHNRARVDPTARRRIFRSRVRSVGLETYLDSQPHSVPARVSKATGARPRVS